jgi:hypothetical protein
MFYYLKFYIKYTFIALLLFLFAVVFYEIYQYQNPVYLEVGKYTIYTKQNIIIFGLILLIYILFKFFRLLITLNNFFVNFKYRLYEKTSTLKSYFNFKQKTESDVLKEIILLKRKKLFRQALKVTTEYYFPSDKLFFWHLFLLLKLGKRRDFLKSFTSRPIGMGIPLFQKIFLKKISKIRQILMIKNLFLSNPDNQVFTFIYSDFLFKRGYVKKAHIVLMNFINNKRILMTDIHCSYLMNLLAIKIERALGGEHANDFTLNYKDNIQTYYEKKKR